MNKKRKISIDELRERPSKSFNETIYTKEEADYWAIHDSASIFIYFFESNILELLDSKQINYLAREHPALALEYCLECLDTETLDYCIENALPTAFEECPQMLSQQQLGMAIKECPEEVLTYALSYLTLDQARQCAENILNKKEDEAEDYDLKISLNDFISWLTSLKVKGG